MVLLLYSLCSGNFFSWPYFIFYPVFYLILYSFFVVSIIPSLFYPLFIPHWTLNLSLIWKPVSPTWFDKSFADGIILMIVCSVPVSYLLYRLKFYWVNNWWNILMILCSVPVSYFFYPIKFYWVNKWWDKSDSLFSILSFILDGGDYWWGNADYCFFQCLYYFPLFLMGTKLMG